MIKRSIVLLKIEIELCCFFRASVVYVKSDVIMNHRQSPDSRFIILPETADPAAVSGQ